MINTKLNVCKILGGNIFLETDFHLRQCPCPNCNTLITKWVMKSRKERYFICQKCDMSFKTEPVLKVTKILKGEHYDN